MKKLIALASAFLLTLPAVVAMPAKAMHSSVAENTSGKILLQVEQNGEAWYVYPENEKRYYLGRPQDAFDIMRYLGLGITNADLNKIPKDGTPWDCPAGIKERVRGRILLQVQEHGEAWYIHPDSGKRFYLGRPDDAFRIMRELGLGATDSDIESINETTIADDGKESNKGVTVTEGDANVILNAEAENNGVALAWTESNRGTAFLYYKVVRSKTNANLKYSTDGYIKALSDIENLSYVDNDVITDTNYYYRVCVLYNGGQAATGNGTNSTQEECSNVVQITAKDETDDGDEPTDSNDLVSPTLETTVDTIGTHLSWTKNMEESFKYYKVVRSETNDSPRYPEDGYISVQGRDETTYTDTSVKNTTGGVHYYRICSVNNENEVFCGNVKKVENGTVSDVE